VDQRDIDRAKHRLELQRNESLRFLSDIEDQTRLLDVDSPQDIVDQCVLNMSRDSLFDRSSQQRITLYRIDSALKRNR
jgi:RNA polymerase-binding transcription factor DksA